MTRNRRWPRYVGQGCATLAVVAVLLLFGTVFLLRISGDKTIATRAALDAALPATALYVPPQDGGFEPDRIERFLAVRRAMEPVAREIAAIGVEFGRMARYETIDEDSVSGREFAADVGTSLKGMFRLGKRLNGYLTTRNEALLAAEMGLGEYTWLYVTLHHVLDGNPPLRFALSNPEEEPLFDARVRHDVRRMAIDCAAAHPGDPFWSAEATALRSDPGRLPLADGFPDGALDALAPYREALESVYVADTCEMDLSLTEREGIGFEHR